MLTTRKAAPGLILALIACCITPSVIRATDAPDAFVAVQESLPHTADATTQTRLPETPLAVQAAASEVPAASAAPSIPEPMPTAVPTAVPTPTRPAYKPAAPRIVTKAAAVATTPPARVSAAKAVSRPVASHRLTGRLELAAGTNQPVAAGEVAEGVVYFLPKTAGARPKPERFSVDTHSKGFKPALLVVPQGSTVSFPNRDQILHNVFSTTPGAAFDLGTYGPGQSRQTRFNKPGLVIVNCNVHNSMRSNVLVLATPYYVRPGRDGRFALDGLPTGPGTLVFWHPRANAQSMVVTGRIATPVVRRLVASRAPLSAHRH